MWRGSAFLEPGRLIYTGRVGVAHRHSHVAVLLVLVTSGRATLVDAAGRSLTMTSAVLPVGAVHGMSGVTARCVLSYLDPASVAAIRLRHRVAASGDPSSVHAWVAAAAPVAGLGTETAGAQNSSALVRRAVHELTGVDGPSMSVAAEHPALRAAMEVLPQMLDGPVRLGDLAQRVGLSADRIGRLFAGQLGLSFPAYVRWLRLRTAISCVQNGMTLTDAAHNAGFADSAHLTRVCRQMFGMAPAVLARRIQWST